MYFFPMFVLCVYIYVIDKVMVCGFIKFVIIYAMIVEVVMLKKIYKRNKFIKVKGNLILSDKP